MKIMFAERDDIHELLAHFPQDKKVLLKRVVTIQFSDERVAIISHMFE